MSDLIDTTEMYLRTIYELIEDGVTPMRARIAEQLGHSGPTVSQTVARMQRDGLVVVSDDRHLELTDEGLEIATRVMRKHRLAERLLIDVIGMDLAEVHDEACRWEHVMSERVERRLLELLDGPVTSPYGNAIPGLAELGMQVPPPAPSGISVVDALADDVSSVTLVRIGENPQAAPAVLEALVGIGLVPGTMLALSRDGDRYEVATSTGAVSLDESTARHLFVAPEATRH